MMENDATTPDGSRVRPHVPGARGDAALNEYLTRLVVRMVEMEQGLRPVSLLDDHASPLAARRIRQLVHLARSGRRPGARRTAPAAALTTSSFHPSAGVTEGVVILTCDERVRAFCIRLEQEGDRWWIVDLAPPEGGLAPAVTMASRTGALLTTADGRRWSSGRTGVDHDHIDELDGGPVDAAGSDG